MYFSRKKILKLLNMNNQTVKKNKKKNYKQYKKAIFRSKKNNKHYDLKKTIKFNKKKVTKAKQIGGGDKNNTPTETNTVEDEEEGDLKPLSFPQAAPLSEEIRVSMAERPMDSSVDIRGETQKAEKEVEILKGEAEKEVQILKEDSSDNRQQGNQDGADVDSDKLTVTFNFCNSENNSDITVNGNGLNTDKFFDSLKRALKIAFNQSNLKPDLVNVPDA